MKTRKKPAKPACCRGSRGLRLPPDVVVSLLPAPHLSCFPTCPDAAARADYAESEKLIAEQLTGLQRDAAWTKSYMVSALLLSKECMQVSDWLAGCNG